MRRQQSLLVALALLVGTAGCLGTPAGDVPTATETSTANTETPTATLHDFEFAPDSRTPVQLRNEWTEPVSMRVTVVRAATNETVHDETYEVHPQQKPWSVYDIASATSAAGEQFTVAVSARNQHERVTVTTTECADVTAVVDEEGDLTVWATC